MEVPTKIATDEKMSPRVVEMLQALAKGLALKGSINSC